MVLDLVRIAVGGFFFVLGILGLFLPLLQGILFLAIAAVLLSPYVPWFHRLKLYLYRRFPAVRHQVQRFKRNLHKRVSTRRSQRAGSANRLC